MLVDMEIQLEFKIKDIVCNQIYQNKIIQEYLKLLEAGQQGLLDSIKIMIFWEVLNKVDVGQIDYLLLVVQFLE